MLHKNSVFPLYCTATSHIKIEKLKFSFVSASVCCIFAKIFLRLTFFVAPTYIMAEEIRSHTLSNGLRIIHIPDNSKVAYCGIAVDAGSRDEAEGKFGLAHFVEHTIFKGTRRRKSWHIINRMERVGGELNAYTTKEETVVYSIFPSEHFSRATELIADLVENSQFPESELAKEREVVLDEVNSYLDTPSEAIYDDYEDLIWKGSSLGHNILGNEADLLTMTGNDCRKHLDHLYVPENMVFFALGSMRTDVVMRTAEKYFGCMKNPLQRSQRIAPATVETFREVRSIDSHQSHTIYGTPVFSMFDKRKYAMFLLNNILGGPGMNSLLNIAIRERRGYAYTVESSLSLLSDCGLFTIYFGSDAKHVRPSLRIIDNTIDTLATKPLSARALDAAKKQYIGQLRVASDSREAQALAAAKSMLYFNRISTDEETAAHITDITSADLMDMAALLTPSGASLLTLQ